MKPNLIEARFAGLCAVCRQSIIPGQIIALDHITGRYSTHASCHVYTPTSESQVGLDYSIAGAFVRQNHPALDNYLAANSKQEKEEKVYQVTVENLATGAVSNEQFKTQEEAQLALETKVANFRSSLTAKTFFTASLLNIRTGVFLGSVTDAPPPVVLVNASPASS